MATISQRLSREYCVIASEPEYDPGNYRADNCFTVNHDRCGLHI